MKTVYALVVALLFASCASAQVITGYTCPIRQGPVIVATMNVTLAGLTCNQPPVTSTVTINATQLSFDDPAFPATPDPAARACISNMATVLNALPFSPTIGYTATCTADSATGSSPISLPSVSFTHPGVQPPAPTNVKVVK